MFIQFYTIAGVSVAAIKISLQHSTGIFVMSGKNRQDILNKAFAELELKIAETNKSLESAITDITQPVLSPYIFA